MPYSPQWTPPIFLISMRVAPYIQKPGYHSLCLDPFLLWLINEAPSMFIYPTTATLFRPLHLLPSWWNSLLTELDFFSSLSPTLARWIFLIKCKYNNFTTLLKNIFSGFLSAGVLSSNSCTWLINYFLI